VVRIARGGAYHIRFDDDGTTERVAHDAAAREELLHKMTPEDVAQPSKKSGKSKMKVKAVDDHGHAKEITRLMEPGGEAEHVRPLTEPSFLESMPDDVFFVILDYLVTHPHHSSPPHTSTNIHRTTHWSPTNTKPGPRHPKISIACSSTTPLRASSTA
jgi:hypothetical protein